jgi:dolichol-phosphate mannosyltransferase
MKDWAITVYTIRHAYMKVMAAVGWVFELGRFCLVGASGVLVNLAVFQAGILWGIPLLSTSALAFVVAATSNYAFNRAWTFRAMEANDPTTPPASSRPPATRASGMAVQWSRFLGASIVGLGANLAVLYALTGWFGLWYLPGQLAGIAAGTLLNFHLSRYWVFKTAKPAPGFS